MKNIKSFNEAKSDDMISIMREMEKFQFELHTKKENGEITKEEFDGYSLCMFKLKSLLRDNNI